VCSAFEFSLVDIAVGLVDVPAKIASLFVGQSPLPTLIGFRPDTPIATLIARSDSAGLPPLALRLHPGAEAGYLRNHGLRQSRYPDQQCSDQSLHPRLHEFR
jgi:hypothetical protein